MSAEITHKQYHEYLLTRSRLGHLYRSYVLYPKVVRYLEGRTLDVGCGIGDLCLFRENTVGCDVNPYNVNHCKERGVKEAYLIEDGFPFPEKAFDSVLLDNVLEHLEEPSIVLDEVRRVLKDGGRFVVGVPGEKGYASDPDHKVFYDKEGLRALMKSYGFREETTFCTPVDLKFLSKKLRQYCLYGVYVKDDSI